MREENPSWTYMVDYLLTRFHSVPSDQNNERVTGLFCTYVEKNTPMLIKGVYYYKGVERSS